MIGPGFDTFDKEPGKCLYLSINVNTVDTQWSSLRKVGPLASMFVSAATVQICRGFSQVFPSVRAVAQRHGAVTPVPPGRADFRRKEVS